MIPDQPAQAGTVLPICLLFLFLIAQLAMSAVETAALNQAMVASLHHADDVSRVERLAFQHAYQKMVAPQGPVSLEVGMDVALGGADTGTPVRAFRFLYRIEPVDESAWQSQQFPWQDRCVRRHRVDTVIYGRSETALRRNTKHHYLCCADGLECSDPDLSVWLAD